MVSCIYAIVNSENYNMYIGSAVDLDNRRRKHKHLLRLNKHHSPILQNAWNKYGESSFSFEVIEFIPHAKTRSDLELPEQKWINFFKPKYNICTVANSMLGFKHSETTKKKLSVKRTTPSPLKGRKLSIEHIEKVASQLRGRKYSNEVNAKKGLKGELNPYYGRIHNSDIRNKMRLAQAAFRERKPKRKLYQFDICGKLIATFYGLDDMVNKT